MANENEKIKRAVRKLIEDIETGFDPKGTIINTLFSKAIVTIPEKKAIQKIEEPGDRAQELLQLLFSSPNKEGFIVFKNALKDDRTYKYLAELIDKAIEEFNLESNTDNKNGSAKEEELNEKLKVVVQENLDEFERGFDPKSSVLNALFAQDVITIQERKQILKVNEKEDRARELIEILLSKPKKLSKTFIVLRAALAETREYKFLDKLFNDEPDHVDNPDGQTPPIEDIFLPHQKILQRNYPTLANNMDATEIANILFSKEVITRNILDQIRCKETTLEKNQIILDTLLKQQQKEFDIFVESLMETEQKYLGALLKTE